MMEPEIELPERLRRDLMAASAPRGKVPAEVDQAILSQVPAAPPAAPPLAAPQARPWPTLVRVASLTAAAGLLLVVGLWWRASGAPDLQQPEGAPHGDLAALRTEDVDGSGRVDILNALALARRIESGTESDARFDYDRDGTIDRRDVEHVAREAVRIDA